MYFRGYRYNIIGTTLRFPHLEDNQSTFKTVSLRYRENDADVILNEIEIRRQPIRGSVAPNTKTTFCFKTLKSQFKTLKRHAFLSLDKIIHLKSFKSDLSLRKRHAFQVRLKGYTFDTNALLLSLRADMTLK